LTLSLSAASGRFSGRLFTVCLLFGLTAQPSAAGAKSGAELTGDILQLLIPAAGLGATYYLDDAEGRGQLAGAWIATMGVTVALKLSIDKTRPDGGSRSFPSGHTSFAFSGAAFIQQRYGWKYGLPAYAGAAFTACSRVFAGRHFVEDVVAGAALGIGMAWYFTTPFEDITVQPLAGSGFAGLGLGMRW